MDKTLIDDLQTLAKVMPDDARYSKTARLRAYLPLVEQALGSGATHAAVLLILKTRGLEMTPGVFSATLRRLRRAGPSKPTEPAVKAIPPSALPSILNPHPKPFHGRFEPVDLEHLETIGKGKKS